MSDYKPHVVIDEQKNIILPEELKNHMVQYDHNVKTITFDCPRYSDGRDLSTMRIYVNFFRKSGEKDGDVCENITVDSKDNNLIHFEWVPKRSATLEGGVLAFLICAEKEDAGGNQENAWHTKLCKDLKIAEGLDCLKAVIEKYPTIITYLLTRMEDVESIATPEAMQAYVNQYLLDYPPSGMTDEERALLEENVALTKQIQTDLAATAQAKADAIICEAEGSTIVITDSSDAGLEELNLYGRSEQKSTSGKNLLKNAATSQTVNGVTFTVNDDGSVTANGTATDDATLMVAGYKELELEHGASYTLSGCPANGSTSTYRLQFYKYADKTAYDIGEGATFVFANEGNDYNIAIRIVSGVTVSDLVFEPMLRLASITDDTYEPYTENSITLSQPIELNGIKVTDPALATYTDENGQMWCADYIDAERGVLVQRVKRLTVDGSTSIERRATSVNSAKARFRLNGISDKLIPANANINGVIMCDKLFTTTASNTYKCVDGISCDSSSNILLYIDCIAELSTTDASLWLAENPLVILYALATPIETPLPEADQIALRSLHTYCPITHITNDANAYMEIKYVADTENHIKQNYIPLSKYTALEERVAAIEELVIS